MGKILRIALLFVLSMAYTVSWAQQATEKTVTGQVSDEKGVTLPGVTVTVKDTKTTVITNVDGRYTIKVPATGRVLVFSFIGMESFQATINNRNAINVTLKSSSTNLQDVVVIGYGSQKRGDVNGAISSIKASDIADIPQASVDQLLQGKAAGVTVTQNSGAAGSQTSVHIRGITSLSGTNEPLYVIDGVPISGDATNKSTSGRSVQLSRTGGGADETGVSPLSQINPSDIESIDILKDASASAIYGNRAANGVIIITTKRGKSGSGRITYDGYYGYSQQGKFLDMMNLQQYANLQNVLADAFRTGRRGEFSDPSLLGSGTNWQKEIFRTGRQQSHQLSLSGAKDGVDYYISGGYFNQDGTLLGNDYNRYTFRTNVNGQVKSWLKVGTTLTGSRSNQNAVLSNNTGIIYTALLSAPDNVVYNPDGSYAGPSVDASGQTQGSINPVAQALSLTNNLVSNNVNGSIYADLKFYKDLTLRSEVNGDFNWATARTFNPTYQWGTFSNQTAKLSEYLSNSTYWALKEYLTYTHTFAIKHSITGLLGYEVNEATWGGVTNTVSNFVAGNTLQTLNLGDNSTALLDEYKGSQVLESAYARAIYTYNNKYSLTATIRSDKSSKFAEGHQVGYFPSFAGSWRLSDEKFMASAKKYIDNIKIRLGYGQVGNQEIPNYAYGSSLRSVTTGLGTGFLVNNVSNANLKWETGIQTDAGVDFAMFNGRIEATFDYFNKTSSNFLFQTPLPAFLLGGTAEYSSAAVINPPYINGGKVSNKGFDFSINSHNIVTKDFKWNTSIVFSRYKNQVISLATGVPFITQSIANGFINLPVTLTAPGGPVGEFYGYKVQGVIKTQAQLQYLAAHPQFGLPVSNNPALGNKEIYLGDLQYVDANGDGKVDEKDQVPLGSPQPDFTYGITNNFSYKNFDVSIFLNGSYGGKILNAVNYATAGLSSLYSNQLASSANFWTPSNPNSNIPAPKAGYDNQNLFMSDRFLESASFLRIQNVQVGYTLPGKLMKKLKVERIRFYASGQNLYVFTPYKGLDPEIGSQNQSVFLTNVDQGRYPIPRTITFGINAQF